MISRVKESSYSPHAEEISIGVVWLFQVSGVVGISLGYEQWFISKTPVILCLTFILLVINFPLTSVRSILVTCFFFVAGMVAEYIGVTYAILFGSYTYGSNLGLKIGGVPYLIGLYWALLVLVTGVSANQLSLNKPVRILIGAGLMVCLDFFMEQSAPLFDYWSFTGDVAPLGNYVTWFGLAIILHFGFQHFQLSGSRKFSAHVLIAQFFFFIYFYVFYSI